MVVSLSEPLVPFMTSVLVPVGVLLFVVRVEFQDGPVADFGLKLAVARDGSPVTLRLTLPEKVFSGFTVTTTLTLEPRRTVEGEGAEMVKPLTFWVTRFELL